MVERSFTYTTRRLVRTYNNIVIDCICIFCFFAAFFWCAALVVVGGGHSGSNGNVFFALVLRL